MYDMGGVIEMRTEQDWSGWDVLGIVPMMLHKFGSVSSHKQQSSQPSPCRSQNFRSEDRADDFRSRFVKWTHHRLHPVFIYFIHKLASRLFHLGGKRVVIGKV